MSEPKSGEIVVEVDTPRNSPLWFYPVNRAVESRFFPARTGDRNPPSLNQFQMKGIPGERIHLDVKKRCGRITHELNDKSKKEELEQAKQAALRFSVPLRFADPKEDEVYDDLSEEMVQTWLFWMSRHAERNEVKLVQGSLPTTDDIKATGKVVRLKYHNRAKEGDVITGDYKHEMELAGEKAK